jgi:hypothetical protein
MSEQRERLVDGEPVWLFCPLCRRIVSGRASATMNAETFRKELAS